MQRRIVSLCLLAGVGLACGKDSSPTANAPARWVLTEGGGGADHNKDIVWLKILDPKYGDPVHGTTDDNGQIQIQLELGGPLAWVSTLPSEMLLRSRVLKGKETVVPVKDWMPGELDYRRRGAWRAADRGRVPADLRGHWDLHERK